LRAADVAIDPAIVNAASAALIRLQRDFQQQQSDTQRLLTALRDLVNAKHHPDEKEKVRAHYTAAALIGELEARWA